jgi:cytochrome c-type biogenesis protein CcmH/NrfG
MQWQMKELNKQLKQSMIYGTPQELGLGSMYQEFLEKYDEILEEQEVARELRLKKERDNAWRHAHRKEILTAKVVYVVAVTMGLLEIVGLYFTL